MKKFLVTLNLLAGMLFLTAAAEPNYSTPESTVRTHVYAIFEGNAEKAYQCFDKSTQDLFSLNNFLPLYHYLRIPVIQNDGMVFFRLNRAKRQGSTAIVKIMQTVPESRKTDTAWFEILKKAPANPTPEESKAMADGLRSCFENDVPLGYGDCEFFLVKEKDGWKILFFLIKEKDSLKTVGNTADIPKEFKKDLEILEKGEKEREKRLYSQDTKSVTGTLTRFILMCQKGDLNDAYYKYIAETEKKRVSNSDFWGKCNRLRYDSSWEYNEQFPFVFLEVKEDKDKASVTVEHKFVDTEKISQVREKVKEIYPMDMLEWETFLSALNEIYQEKIPTVTKTVTYHLVKENGKWKLLLPEI